jgi:hypothetical protein
MTDEPADRMRERSQRHAAVTYLLINVDRLLLSAGLVVVIFGALVGASFVIEGAAAALRSNDAANTTFQALISGTVTGVTIVLTLNQLVLSQELGALDDQRERMRGAMSFREEVGELLGKTPPAEPSAFLAAMVEETGDRAAALREVAFEDDELDRLVDSTVQNASAVSDRLQGKTFGEFDVVRNALDFNYSWKLYAARRLMDREEVPEAANDRLEALADALRLFGPAREHFKTLYFQAELIDLSRTVLYASVPALVTSTAVVLFLDTERYTGTLFGVDVAVLVVSAAGAIAVAPFAVLLAYVVRIATITDRTLSIGPFILRETDRDTQD